MKDEIDGEMNVSNVIRRLIDRSEFEFPRSEEFEFLASDFY
jgi:hypothetical protein